MPQKNQRHTKKDRSAASARISPFTTLCVLFAAAFVFAALLSPAAVTGLAGRTGLPFYRGADGREAALVIAVSWEPAALESILDALDGTRTGVTFAVTPELVENSPELIKSISARGQDVDLMWPHGAPSAEELQRAASLLEAVTGSAPKTVLCESAGAESAARAAARLGMTAVVGSVDLRPVGDDGSALRQRAASFAFGGCVFIAEPTPALGRELTHFVDNVKNMGFDIVSVRKMVYN